MHACGESSLANNWVNELFGKRFFRFLSYQLVILPEHIRSAIHGLQEPICRCGWEVS